MSNLTDEQLKRIEENRQRALQIKSKRTTPTPPTSILKKDIHSPSYSGSHANHPLPSRCGNTSSETIKCILLDKDRFLVTCKYDPKLISVFKSIPSRKYDPACKGWTFDISEFKILDGKTKKLGRPLPSLDNAVLVKSNLGGNAAVELNSDKSSDGNTLCVKSYLTSSDRFEIDAAYNASCVALFNSIPSKSYDITTRRWSFNLSDYNALYEQLKKVPGVQIEPLSSTVMSVFRDRITGKQQRSDAPDSDLLDLDENLVMSLMPFQKEGVKFAISRKGRILLADDMGLGKTVQSICIAFYYKESWPLLVVCPSSVRLMWKEALLKWLPSNLIEDHIEVVLSGRGSSRSSKIIIISYDLLTKYQKEYTEKRFKIAIIDESHFIKNFKTARTQAVKSVVKHAKHVVLLSGTPALSRPVELFTQLSLLRPDLFSNFHQFGTRYCNAKQTPWGWEYSGSSNMNELKLVLQETIMLRRTKEDVLAQLPPKLRRSVTIDTSSLKSNSRLKQALKSAHEAVERKGISGAEKHGALLQYFNETAHVKLPAVKAYVVDLLEGGHKFLLFAHHRIVLDTLAADVEKKGYEYIRVDGNTSADKRQSEVARFQEKSACRLALLSITAANMGLNLHAASLVVFAELFWNPGILVQAEDRCYRIGQKDVVNVHYLVAKGTSDDYIWEMVKKKLEVLGKAGLNKSNFDDTESHVAGVGNAGQSRSQHSILHYFQKSTDAKLENGSPSQLDMTSLDDISDEELLKIFPVDDALTDGTAPSTSQSDVQHSTFPESDDAGTEPLFGKRENSVSDDEDLNSITNWKRKKKRHLI